MLAFLQLHCVANLKCARLADIKKTMQMEFVY